MAKLSGTDLAGFESAAQDHAYVSTTPKDAAAFMTGPDLPKIMDLVRGFCFEHDLLGDNVKSKDDAIGIETPTARRSASAKNVKLRFDPTLHEARRGREALITPRLTALLPAFHLPPATASRGSRCRGVYPIARVMNIVPGRGARIILAMLPFILIAIIYVVGLGGAARGQS